MARVIIIFCLCLTFIPSCKSTQEYKKQYYPIGLYLESELAQIDSFKLPITRCFTENKKSDSTIIELKNVNCSVVCGEMFPFCMTFVQDRILHIFFNPVMP